MWNIIFHSLLVLHWWPYTTLATLVCVCVCARSWRAWPYSELWPRSALRTVVDGPPCQTLSLSYHSGPHTFKWTHFVITSSHRNIIDVSCVGTCLKLHMLLAQCVCNAVLLDTADCFLALSQQMNFAVDCFHRKLFLATEYFWKNIGG